MRRAMGWATLGYAGLGSWPTGTAHPGAPRHLPDSLGAVNGAGEARGCCRSRQGDNRDFQLCLQMISVKQETTQKEGKQTAKACKKERIMCPKQYKMCMALPNRKKALVGSRERRPLRDQSLGNTQVLSAVLGFTFLS